MRLAAQVGAFPVRAEAVTLGLEIAGKEAISRAAENCMLSRHDTLGSQIARSFADRAWPSIEHFQRVVSFPS